MSSETIRNAPHPVSSAGGNGGGSGAIERHDGWGASGPPIASAKLAMMLALVASVMLFVTMVGGYIIARYSGREWPPAGFPKLPASLWGNTVVILSSSLSLMYGQCAVKRGQVRGLQIGLAFASILGLAFLILQASVWQRLSAAGLLLSSGLYGSFFYLLTIVHALHVAGGLLFLTVVSALSFRNRYSSADYLTVEVLSIYWHFVGMVWLFLFVILYLL